MDDLRHQKRHPKPALRQHFGCHDFRLVNLAHVLAQHVAPAHSSSRGVDSFFSRIFLHKKWRKNLQLLQLQCSNCWTPDEHSMAHWHSFIEGIGIESSRAPVLLFLRLCIQARPWQRSCGPVMAAGNCRCPAAPAAHADSADCISYIKAVSRLYQRYTKDIPRIHQGYQWCRAIQKDRFCPFNPRRKYISMWPMASKASEDKWNGSRLLDPNEIP